MICSAHPLPHAIHKYLPATPNAQAEQPHFGQDRRHALGAYAEALAVGLYRMGRFEILAQDIRVDGVQIDFIAQRNAIIHFVEVKYRKSASNHFQSISVNQMRRLTRAAQHYAREHNQFKIQIDLIIFDRSLHWRRIDNLDTSGHINC